MGCPHPICGFLAAMHREFVDTRSDILVLAKEVHWKVLCSVLDRLLLAGPSLFWHHCRSDPIRMSSTSNFDQKIYKLILTLG